KMSPIVKRRRVIRCVGATYHIVTAPIGAYPPQPQRPFRIRLTAIGFHPVVAQQNTATNISTFTAATNNSRGKIVICIVAPPSPLDESTRQELTRLPLKVFSSTNHHAETI